MSPPEKQPSRTSGHQTKLPQAGSEEDDDLMRLVAFGNQRAAKAVVERHLPSIMAQARHMLGSLEEAEDVVQEAFLKLWKQAEKWEPRRALISTWLRRVITNLCIDRLRQRRTVPLSPNDERAVEADQYANLERKHIQKKVGEALADLPERQSIALSLCHFEGLSQKEAAIIMEISEHALESLLARARRSLKKALEGEWKQLLPETVDGGSSITRIPERREKK